MAQSLLTADTLQRTNAEGSIAAPSEPPRRIGRYRVVGVLGSGGMGVVYEAVDDMLARRVAIKHLLRTHAGDRVLREAQALARLSHPNVVAVYEVVEAEGEVFIVMERIEGRTLTTWLDERAPSRAERLDVLAQAGRGVAAAHAVGIIHRDLKPQNIMVGDDGRARVMDFGLARTTDAWTAEPGLDALRPLAGGLATPLTGTGGLLGTRGYMAPEQWRGQAVDERSDVFGFSVVAHELLHGRRLFVGSEVEVMQAALSGQIDAPLDSDVPTWLDAVIRRGLAVEPDARWPTMQALLDALARDPIARRRRVARGVLALVVALALATGAAFGYLALAQKWAHERAEQLASQRLEAVEAAIARAHELGDPDAAELAFRAFVSDPAHRGTRALSQAWMHRGDRVRDDPGAAQAAYAEAYSLANEPDDAVAALRSMAEVFHETWDGPRLSQTLALLRARGAEDPRLAELSFDAAVWQRDLAGAQAALETGEGPHVAWLPMLEQLGRVRGSDLRVDRVSVLPPGGPARLAMRPMDPRDLWLLDEQLAVVETLRLDVSALHMVPHTGWALGQREGEMLVFDLLAGGAQRWRGASAASASPAVAFDLRGDATPEVLLTRTWPALGLRALEVGGGPEWVPHPATDVADSTIESFAVADLDGDGIEELAAALGPWHAFDLRVFRRGEEGSLELLALHRLGRTSALAVVHRGRQPLLAAITDEDCPAPELFPEPPHTGAPAGVHLFAWTGSELRELEFIPLPREHRLARFSARAGSGVGDFDGDGREDLAFNLRTESRGGPNSMPARPWLLLLRQTDAGFDPLHVADLKVWGAAELDDDAALELLVSSDDLRLHVLGAGERALPASSPPRSAARPPAQSLADPLLIERWRRAEDLVALGLPTSAATSLRDAEPLADDPEVQLTLLDRAAELFFEAGALEDALALDRRVRAHPGFSANALERSARALAQLGRHDEALTEAEALLASPGHSPQQAELARSLIRELEVLVNTAARVELRFDTPLAAAWQLHTPGALRRDFVRSTLALTIPAGIEPVAELPLDWTGGPLSLELDIEVERLEYGACLRVAIVDEAGEAWLGGGVCTDGGGGGLRQVVTVKAGDDLWSPALPEVIRSGRHPRRVQIRGTYLPARELFEFAFVEGQTTQLWPIARRGARPGRHQLVISAFMSGGPPALGVGELHRISVRGARLATPSREALDRDAALQLLAENQPQAAIAALDHARVPHPRAEQARLLAHARLHDLDGLARAAPALLTHLNDDAWLADFVLALRVEPLAAATLRSVAGPTILPLLGRAWEVMGNHRNDPDMHGRVLEQLANLEAFEPTTVEQRGALRRLLYLRGWMWRHAGATDAARRDLAAAVALPASGELPAPERETWSKAHLELARMLVTEDRQAAARHVEQALCLAAWPNELRAWLADDGDLAGLLAGAARCAAP